MKKFLAFIALPALLLAATQYFEPMQIKFDNRLYSLAGSAKPVPNLFTQEYLLPGEKLDSFSYMLSLNTLKFDATPEQAVEQKINDLKELKAKALKYRQLSASELTQTLPPISADIQKVVNDEICLVIKKCTSFDTLNECLDYLARLSSLVPNYGEIAKHASEHLPLTSILANHTVMDSEGHLISDDDEENY